jgi:hypothetical protein
VQGLRKGRCFLLFYYYRSRAWFLNSKDADLFFSKLKAERFDTLKTKDRRWSWRSSRDLLHRVQLRENRIC